MEKLDINKVSSFLASLRKQRGLNQDEMATLLSVSGRTVRRWENGSSLPGMDDVVNICREFNLSLEEVFEGELKAESEYKRKISSVQEGIEEITNSIDSTKKSITDINSRFNDLQKEITVIQEKKDTD